MNKKVIIIGGEGNGGVIAACIEDNRRRFGDPEWEVAGFVNDYETQVLHSWLSMSMTPMPMISNPRLYSPAQPDQK